MVLTHTNADFDSLASAVAVAKVWKIEHPEHPTHVVMPRGSNPLVSRFLAYHKHLLPLRGYATIQADDLQRVGVVDTSIGRPVEPPCHASHPPTRPPPPTSTLDPLATPDVRAAGSLATASVRPRSGWSTPATSPCTTTTSR